ncbi:MAG: Crp/Fnr family transcriptional regulator [Bacteroidota bacterium]
MSTRKDEVLIPSGSVNKYSYFVASGSLATTMITESGESRAVWFHFDNKFRVALCPDSYFLDEPTQYEMRALEDTRLIRFHKQNIDAWAAKYPAFNQLYFKDLANISTIIQDLRSYKLSHTPLQFLTYINNKYPVFSQRLSSKHMAHFLGVSPEWYSKLKKKF